MNSQAGKSAAAEKPTAARSEFIDLELALAQLDPLHRQILMLTYRDGIRHKEAAHMPGMSERNIYHLIPLARRRLTDILDRLDLL